MTDRYDYEESEEPPGSGIFNEDNIGEIRDFLGGTGAPILILKLEKDAKRFMELDEEIPISSTTLTKRLNEANDIGLVDIDIRPVGDEGRKYWKLTDVGKIVQEEIQKTDLARIQRRIWELEIELDEEVVILGDQMRENTDELNQKYVEYITGAR